MENFLLNRPYVYYDYTRALCSKCLEIVDAKIIFQDDHVFMDKRCPTHGKEKVFISTDIAYYKKIRQFMKASEMPHRWNTQTERGCPFDCGLCPDHEQHSCLTVLEITDSCNLSCPICYANSEISDDKHKSLDKIEFMLEQIILNEKQADIVQISGGEPTMHPQFFEILDLAKSKPIRHLMINSNGIKIAEDISFVEKLSTYKPAIEIYLQFDSLKPENLQKIRGKDLSAIRHKAIENLNEFNISTTLVSVVQKGINDDEIGEIIDFATQQKSVRGVVFQPVQQEGRTENYNPQKHRLTLSEVRQNIIEESDIFGASDIIPVPCHPDNLAMGFAFKGLGKITPLTKFIDPQILLEGKRNTFVLEQDDELKEMALKVFSTHHSPSSAASSIRDLLCCLPQIKIPQNIGYDNVFRVVIMEFMDRYNLDIRSVKKSCVHIAHEDGRIIPFDTYNLLYR